MVFWTLPWKSRSWFETYLIIYRNDSSGRERRKLRTDLMCFLFNLSLRSDLCGRARFPWSFLTKRKALLCFLLLDNQDFIFHHGYSIIIAYRASLKWIGHDYLIIRSVKRELFHLNYSLPLYIHICRLMKKCFYVSVLGNAIFCNSKMIVFTICSFFK